MAKRQQYYIAYVLKQVYQDLQGICKPQREQNKKPLETVYVGHRPSATDNHSEFLVASLSKSVYSHGPYQNAAFYLDIVVKNKQGGIENTTRLQELLDEVNRKFPIKCKEDEIRWIIKNPQLVISGDDQLGFTVWRLRGSLFINTVDRYGEVDEDTNTNP